MGGSEGDWRRSGGVGEAGEGLEEVWEPRRVWGRPGGVEGSGEGKRRYKQVSATGK